AGWQLSRAPQGLRARAWVPARDAQSISTETTFAHDLADREILRGWLLELVDHLAARLRGHELRARTVELKVRSSDFRTRMRSQSLPEATDVTAELWTAARMLFDSTRWADLLPVRLLGVGVSRLTRQAATQ